MKKHTKMLFALAAALMLTASLAACTTAAPTATPAAPAGTTQAEATPEPAAPIVDFVYYAPGAEQLDAANVLKLVNDRLKADNVGLNMIIKFIGWDAWDDRINVMLSTGEKFDMFEVMENRVPTGVYASRGGLAPLNDQIEQYGQAIKSEVPDFCWDQITINGNVYAIPAYWRDTTQVGSPVGSLEARQDLLDKYNIPLPKTFDELVSAISTVMAGEPDLKDAYFCDHDRANPAVWLERTFDSFPFYSDFNNEIVCVREDGKVEPWVATPEFKQECACYREMYQKGIINPDVLSVPTEIFTGNTPVSEGKLIISASGDYTTLIAKDPSIKVTNFLLAPDKPSYLSLPLWNCNAVPAASEHPESAVKFINWLYSDRANHDLFLFGVEGTHYTVVDPYRVNYTMDSTGNTKLYAFSFWMIGNYKWQRFTAATSDADIASYTTSAKNVKVSIVAGFTFNTDPVKNEFANLQAAIPEVVYPLKYGVVDFDANYDAALQKLKAAGLDAVVAEYQKQLDEWRASKG